MPTHDREAPYFVGQWFDRFTGDYAITAITKIGQLAVWYVVGYPDGSWQAHWWSRTEFPDLLRRRSVNKVMQAPQQSTQPVRLYHYDKPGCRYNPSWHYAHGDAEGFLGHDIPVIDNDWTPPLGRSKVILVNAAGEERTAFVFSWITDKYRPHQRGPIVFLEDRESVAYASQCLLNKIDYL